MTDTTTQEMTRLYREIIRLGQEGLAYPTLAVKRGQQMGALYTQIARLKGAPDPQRKGPKAMAQCLRCKGKGVIASYSHNHGGVCFACKGTGEAVEPKKTPKRPDGPQACSVCAVWVDQVMGVWYGMMFYCGDCEGKVHPVTR